MVRVSERGPRQGIDRSQSTIKFPGRRGEEPDQFHRVFILETGLQQLRDSAAFLQCPSGNDCRLLRPPPALAAFRLALRSIPATT